MLIVERAKKTNNLDVFNYCLKTIYWSIGRHQNFLVIESKIQEYFAEIFKHRYEDYLSVTVDIFENTATVYYRDHCVVYWFPDRYSEVFTESYKYPKEIYEYLNVKPV